MRLRGKGLPELHGGVEGHLYVKLHVHVPEKLGKREEELLKELQGIWDGEKSGKGKEGKSKSFFCL
jgi:molecular chaperone DnaJ